MKAEESANQMLAQVELDRLRVRCGDLERRVDELSERVPENRATVVMFSCDLDKILAGFVIATGAAAAGLETSLFFTFWGLCALKKTGARADAAKTIKEKLLTLMSPSGSTSLGVSRMNFMGIGSRMLRSMMKEKGISTLEELMDIARDLGVKFIACTMSMDAMGVTKQELVDGLEYGGVAVYMADAARSKLTLFI
jgi:peroxiredoxin family protein